MQFTPICWTSKPYRLAQKLKVYDEKFIDDLQKDMIYSQLKCSTPKYPDFVENFIKNIRRIALNQQKASIKEVKINEKNISF